MKANLYIVAAPSGAGKTSLVTALAEQTANLAISISYTTRPMRPGEKDGVAYHFVTPKKFKTMIAADEFFEYAQVFDNFYGTSQHAIEQQLTAGIDTILEIDWQGAQQVRKKYPEAISIFILPPSKSSLLQRLQNRAQDNTSVIKTRMAEANSEISHCDEFDYVIVNDDFKQALEQLKAIITSKRLEFDHQKPSIANLLAELLA